MIYVKYTSIYDPKNWYIYTCETGSTQAIKILDWYGNTNPDTIKINLKEPKIYWKMEYLTEEEVDLHKLELL